MNHSFIFPLGGSLHGFPASAIQQTLLKVETQPVPWMPSFHHGIFSLRGEILPLLDIRPFVNLAETGEEAGSVILIVSVESGRFGTRTGPPRYLPAPAEAWPVHPLASIHPALDSAAEADGQPVTLINPERLHIQLMRAIQQEFESAA